MIDSEFSQAFRYLRLDLSYLSGGYFLFQLQLGLYCLLDVGLLTALNNFKLVSSPILGFERLAMLFTLTGILGAVVSEFKGQYTESIQLNFGTWIQRYCYRAFSGWVCTALVFDLLIWALSLTSRSSIFHLNSSFANFVGFDISLLIMSLIGAFLGALLKATFLANLLPAGILILELTIGGIAKGGSVRWTLSGIFLPLLQTQSLLRLGVLVALYSLITSASIILLLKTRVRWEAKFYLENSRVFQNRGKAGESFSWRIARAIESRHHELGVRYAQLFTNVQFFRLPILFLWLGFVPLISNKILRSGLSERVALPIIAASTVQTVFVIALISPSILESKEFLENEVILFSSMKSFRSVTKLLWQFTCSLWSSFIIVIAILIFAIHGGHVDFAFSLRPMLIAALLSPLVVSISFIVLRLPLDDRFFPIVAVVYYVLDIAILASIKGVSRFEPTSLIANLSGGRGLYQIVLGEKAVSAVDITIWLTSILLLVNFMRVGRAQLAKNTNLEPASISQGV